MASQCADGTFLAMNRAGICRRIFAVAAALAACAAGAPAQPVQGDIKSIGFQANVQARYIVREGQWIPIVVDLQAAGSEHWSGELRVEMTDLDGDRVSFAEPNVTVTGGGTLRRVWCYAVAHRSDISKPLSVDVIGVDGALVTSLPIPNIELISSDTLLLVDMSERPVAALRSLDSGSTSYYAQGWSERRFYRPVCVATIGTREIPDRWIGLESARIIVWDDPNPDLTSDAQLKALAEWVRRGGQLVIGVGQQWGKLSKSALADVLPYAGDKPSVETRQLPQFARRYTSDDNTEFKSPISVTTADLAPGATAVVLDQADSRQVINLITQRLVGSGRVIATAARLRDLFGATSSDSFLRELVEVNLVSQKIHDGAAEALAVFRVNPPVLSTDLSSGIEFRRQATGLMLAAFTFVAAYILLSTFATWSYLGRKKHLSWPVFAAFAIVASLIGSAAIGVLRGVSATVQSVSVVDLDENSPNARATVYLGYKSPNRSELRLGMEGEGNFLRPLTSPGTASSYQTPERYTANSATGELDHVLLRATLKEFEGSWHGPHDGRLRGRLIADRTNGRLTDDSWLQNDLGQPVDGGYVLFLDPRLSGVGGAVPTRVGGLTKRTDRGKYWGVTSVAPAVQVLAVPLGAMGRGAKITQPGRAMYASFESEFQRWSANSPDSAKTEPMLPTLWTLQTGGWINSLTSITGGPLDRSAAAAMLASTVNLYLPNRESDHDFERFGTPVSTEALGDLDITHWLTNGQAVVLLSADGPPPLPVMVDGKPLSKSRLHGRSFYRIRMPLEYVGRPPTGAP